MSASGKSSNRHSEYNRARSGGGGHGIYAAQGRADRAAAERRRAAQQRPVASVPAPQVVAKPRPAPVPAPAPARAADQTSTRGLLVFGALVGVVIDHVIHRRR